MSKYTTELRFLLESGYDLGLTEYPIFDENYRNGLNQKILDHYRFREIGAETPARFRHYLNARLNEIMPLYNQMYHSQLLTYNPMYDHDITETSKKATDGSNTNTNGVTGSTTDSTTINGTASGKNQGASASTLSGSTDTTDSNTATGLKVDSNTPQGLITRANLNGDIYASSAERSENAGSGASHSDQDSNTTSQDYTENSSVLQNVTAATGSLQNTSTAAGTIKNTDDFLRHVAGNSGAKNFSELLNDFRSTFMNIDVLVINELADLFMGVY